jgi:hypothetical protein
MLAKTTQLIILWGQSKLWTFLAYFDLSQLGSKGAKLIIK